MCLTPAHQPPQQMRCQKQITETGSRWCGCRGYGCCRRPHAHHDLLSTEICRDMTRSRLRPRLSSSQQLLLISWVASSSLISARSSRCPSSCAPLQSQHTHREMRAGHVCSVARAAATLRSPVHHHVTRVLRCSARSVEQVAKNKTAVAVLFRQSAGSQDNQGSDEG